MNRFVLYLAGFSVLFAARPVEPLVGVIASDFQIPIVRAALLASAYALPYCFAQLLTGALGDRFGKAMLVRMGLVALSACVFGASLVHSFNDLILLRLLAGLSAAAVIPLSVALLAEPLSPEGRPRVLAEFFGFTLLGQLSGVVYGGMIVTSLGWRAVLAGAGLMTAIAAGAACTSLTGASNAARPTRELGSFRSIMARPAALGIYAGIMAEGAAIYGMPSYVPGLLAHFHAGGAREAALVVSALGVGGFAMSRFTSRFSSCPDVNLSIAAGLAIIVLAIVAVCPFWQGDAAAFLLLGAAFILMHSSLFGRAADLGPGKASNLALASASFFAGQALGPLAYSGAVTLAGAQMPPILAGAILLPVLFTAGERVRRRFRQPAFQKIF